MKFRTMFLAGVLACTALVYVASVSGDQTKTWPFTSAGNYSVSDAEKIEVADGAAKLKLRAVERYDVSLQTYLTNSAESDGVAMGPDVSITRALPYGNPAEFVSRILDGGDANVWERFHVGEQGSAGLNAGNALSTNVAGLVSLFHLDNSTWREEVSGLNGTPGSGASLSTEARLGSHAADFGAGLQDYVRQPSPSILHGSTQFTIAFWVKLREYRVGGLVSSFGTVVNGVSLSLTGSDKVALYVNGVYKNSVSSVPIDEWVHVAATWRSAGGEAKIYFNGLLDSTQVLGNGASLHQSDYYYLSGNRGGYRMNGLLDEVAIFSRALSAVEVAELYQMPKSMAFQVRSTSDEDPETAIEAKEFVGPDGTPDSYYLGNYEELSAIGDFKIWERYAQYKVFLYGPPYAAAEDSFLDAVALLGNPVSRYDDTLAGFQRSSSSDSISVFPKDYDTPYLSLAKQPNGGFHTYGKYVSRVIDGGSPLLWYTLSWGVPEELPITLDGLIALWRMNGGWSDATGQGHNGTPNNITYSQVSAKLGTDSAVFNGDTVSSYANMGNLGDDPEFLVKTVEFWIKCNKQSDGILQLANNATNQVYVKLVNRLVTPVGFSASPATVYVNGSRTSRRLISGWNHVALTTDIGIHAAEVRVGLANGDYLQGMLDEMAVYSLALRKEVIKGHFVSGRRRSTGRARLKLRSGNTDPPTRDFVGQDGTTGSWFDLASHSGSA